MTIGILIFSEPKLEVHTGVDRLIEAGESMGHTVVKIYEPRLSFLNGDIRHQGEALPNVDVIISRPNFIEEPSLRTYAVRKLLASGQRIINGTPTFTWTKNKLIQHMVFDEHNLPCPKWGITRDPTQALELASQINFPVVLKVAFGTHGKGIFYAENPETLRPIAEYLVIRDRNPLIVEEFVEEAKRKDLRVLVVGGEVIAAMERQAPIGDIRANTSNGGTGHQVDLTLEEIALAKECAKVFNLEIAGVDIIRSKRGPLVLEVNSNPGFKELERVTGVDVAKTMIEYAAKQSK